MWLDIEALKPVITASLIAIITAIIVFFREWLKLRTEISTLKLRAQTVEIEDTERSNKIADEAQLIVQRMFVAQSERMRTVEDEMRHQRDLIDRGSTERAELKAQKEGLELSLQ